MPKRIYIIAGEASGDLHGGNLVRELFKVSGGSSVVSGQSAFTAASAASSADYSLTTHHSQLSIRAWGGDRMAAAGAEVVKHYRELAFMGFTQVIMNLRTILRNIDACKKDIEEFKPDALILIDYPGFNLRIAEWAHGKGIPVHYYIGPQVWAWKKGRVHTIKKVVDRMFVILPFEKAWYAKYAMDVEFVGHPLLDAIEQEGRAPLTPLPGADDRPVVALLPGSRQQEIARMMPLMVAIAKRYPAYRFVLAAAPSVPDATYKKGLKGSPITLVKDRTYDVLRQAHGALVTSGTATLETALFGVPEVVCYSGSALNVWIAKRLVDIKYISLVNLIMDREVVRELIQQDLNEKTLSAELERIMAPGVERMTMEKDLRQLREKLGGPGASAKVAAAVWKKYGGLTIRCLHQPGTFAFEMRFSAFLLPFLLSLSLMAQERVLRIGILRDRTIRSVLVMSAKGTCAVFADGERKGEIQVNDGLQIELVGRSLSAKSLALSFTAKERIELVPRLETSGVRLRIVGSKMAERTYPGSLGLVNEGGSIKMTNAVPIEAYTAGVVQAEAGKEHHGEYYKLQSVSCRTYALCNVRKHAPDGFELCDAVHCQVYHGACKQDSINLAVDATKGMVLVDAEIKVIHALFHSNCGGETMNAEDLWTKREPYLRSTMDPYCRAEPHANWRRVLTKQEWVGYLQRRFGIKPTQKAQLEALLNYTPVCRDQYLGNAFPLVPLKHVREDLKLNSTYFSVNTQGDQVVLEGRGFGHGVGLCQEGAMRMAIEGKAYMDILRHYYSGVHLVDVNTLDFFREEEQVPAIAGPRSK